MQKLKEACDAIATDFVENINRTEKGYAWKTLQSSPTGKTEFGVNEDLYHGVSGIAYFLMLHGKQFTNPKSSEAAATGLKSLVAQLLSDSKPISFAFYTGRLGTAYTVLLAGKLGLLENSNEIAKSLCKGLNDYAKEPVKVDDLINGNSGVILGLLMCYDLTKDDFWIKPIPDLVKSLFASAYFSKGGLYWDRSANLINGLCGLSHGASGLAHVFCQLYKATGVDLFEKAALAGLHHERTYFKKDWNNWQDLRKSFMLDQDVERALEKFKNSERDFFVKGLDMNAWCHGAAGIGLQRSYNYSFLKGSYPHLEEELDACIEKTIQTELNERDREMQILCHGGSGNADLFIAEYLRTKDKQFLDKAIEVLQLEITCKEERGNFRCGYGAPPTTSDTSLFMGNAGIGWMLLRCINPEGMEDIMCPEYSGGQIEELKSAISEATMLNALFAKYNDSHEIKGDLKELTQAELSQKLDPTTLERIMFDANQESIALNHVRVEYRQANPIKALDGYEFSLAKHCKLVELEEDYELLVSEGNGLRVIALPDLAAAIADCLKDEKMSATALVNVICEHFEIEEGEKQEVENALQEQLLAMVNASLVSANDIKI